MLLEEKIAIDNIKQRIEDIKGYIEYGLPYSDYLDLQLSFDIVLNLITKLQKENETTIKLNANMSKRHLNDIFKIKKLQKENKEKAEQIDLMADKINEAYFDENDFYTWFEEIFGIIPKGNYKDKIKQYFEQLAKEKDIAKM